MVIVGPPNSVESTLLRMIAGLEDISSGEMLVNQRLINDTLPRERSTGMVLKFICVRSIRICQWLRTWLMA